MKKNKEEEIFAQAIEEYPIDISTAKRFFKLAKDRTGNVKTSDDGTPKLEGKQLGFRMQSKDAYSPTLLSWIEAQENFSDSMRYLMEQEILLNGVRNLAKYIPQVRDLEGAIREQQESQLEETINPSSVVYVPTESPVTVPTQQPVRFENERPIVNVLEDTKKEETFAVPVEKVTVEEKVEPKTVEPEVKKEDAKKEEVKIEPVAQPQAVDVAVPAQKKEEQQEKEKFYDDW
ncbi:hypothetical protein CON36_35815 [Bacillus cereus]|uniref:Uncharacterized protein n=1 Tax=Bacillus cereus TaxID=1396 RepID=A0A9X6SRW4_BACCE|nr:hypothetical protein [Bacillus cereus]PDZ94060.1 hypothetical protein CON36_35815 [Bacillus cereus]